MPLLAVVAVLTLFYVGFKLAEGISRRKAAGVEDVFSLPPGAARRELAWPLPSDLSSQAVARVVAVLERNGAKTLRQDGSQAILQLGSRAGAKMRGLWSCKPLEAPTRVLAQVANGDGAHSLRLRLDDDYGAQMFMGPMKRKFEELYAKSFDALAAILDGELGPRGTDSKR